VRERTEGKEQRKTQRRLCEILQPNRNSRKTYTDRR